jgi:hypothetical protein
MKMMFSKLLNIVLAVVLLCSLLLVSVKTSTSGNSVTGNGVYDPWVDVNGDGIINILDATAIGYAWLAQGDPTRNVNITNWPEPSWKMITVVENFNYTWTVGYPENPLIYVGSALTGGYSRMVLFVRLSNMTNLGDANNRASIVCWLVLQYTYGERNFGYLEPRWYGNVGPNDTVFAASTQPIETLSPFIKVNIQGGSNLPNEPRPTQISCLVSVGVYLRNE